MSGSADEWHGTVSETLADGLLRPLAARGIA
jgi:hypothetical protein